MRLLGRVRWWMLPLVLACLAALALPAGYWGTQQAPQYYIEKLRHEQLHISEAREASHEMTRKVGALAGDLQQPGQWQAVFTQEQINGWLAVDLVEKHAGLLPPGLRDPRVFLEEDRAMVACFYEGIWPAAVYTLRVEPFVAESNKLAIRLVSFRAGLVPVPLGALLDEIKTQAVRHRVPLEWGTAQGDPVVLIPLPEAENMQRKRLVLESVELRQGSLVLSGRTEEIPDGTQSGARWRIEMADQSEANEPDRATRRQ